MGPSSSFARARTRERFEEFASGLSGVRAKVPSVRLKRFLEAEPVDLLKLDIEGGEEAVLRDCRDSLATVRALVLDLHEFDGNRRCTSIGPSRS